MTDQHQHQLLLHLHSSQQCICNAKPLHHSTTTTSSPSSSSSESTSSTHTNKRSNRQNKRTFSLFTSRHSLLVMTFLTLFYLLSLPTPIEAKYRLVPKRRRQQQQQQKQQQQKQQQASVNGNSNANDTNNNNNNNNSNQDNNNNNSNQQQKKLQLEASVHKNEQGQHVLMLSPESTQVVHSAMGQGSTEDTTTVSSNNNTKQQTQSEQKVLFYDPAELKTKAGEPPLPKRVFDEHGREVDMAGKDALLVKPPPPPHHGPPKPHKHDTPIGAQNTERAASSNQRAYQATVSALQQSTQTHDQMIIISTVATMALLVGALSARRLRSRQFLSFCIENESLEDELAYDAAFTTQSTVGASSLYVGGGYDTFASGKYGGDLRWRGDLEKFDV